MSVMSLRMAAACIYAEAVDMAVPLSYAGVF